MQGRQSDCNVSTNVAHGVSYVVPTEHVQPGEHTTISIHILPQLVGNGVHAALEMVGSRLRRAADTAGVQLSFVPMSSVPSACVCSIVAPHLSSHKLRYVDLHTRKINMETWYLVVCTRPNTITNQDSDQFTIALQTHRKFCLIHYLTNVFQFFNGTSTRRTRP